MAFGEILKMTQYIRATVTNT